MRYISLLAGALLALALPASADPIERACLKSDRPASRALCGCIQDVADLTLTNRDQRLASSFFSDPQKAQDIRMSDRRSHEAFWDRYKAFGETAETYCSTS